MKSVTTAFTDAWNQKQGKGVALKVQYKRRYWNGSAYVYEANWTNLAMNKIVDPGTIISKLDAPLLNTMKTSNVNLRLKNKDYEWMEGNQTSGYFASDATATSGYDPFLTQFNIQVGYYAGNVPSGAIAYATLFTGVAIDYLFDTKAGFAEITLSGNEYLLQATSAQGVSDAFTNEATSPATGDGTTKVFTTASLGVGYVSKVRVATVAKTQGSDYTLSNINVYNAGATITFVNAPANGSAIDATGIKWKTLKTVDALVTLLVQQANIASYTVNPVIFPGGLSADFILNKTSDWTGGTVKTNVDTASTPNSLLQEWFLIDDFSSGNVNKWTVDAGPWTVSGGYASTQAVPGTMHINFSQSTGTWRFLYESLGIGGRASYMNLYILGSATTSGGTPTGSGYMVQTASTGIIIYKYQSPTATNIASTGGSVTVNNGDEIRVTRNSTGTITVYQNGVNVLSATDTTYTSFGYLFFAATGGNAGLAGIYWSQNLTGSDAVTSSALHWESAVLDALQAPTAWGLLVPVDTLNGGTITFKTAVSSDNITYDAYVAASGNGQINSALKRYIKVSVDYAAGGGYTAPISPQISQLTVNYTTSTVNLALADFTQKTCYDAIQTLAKLADYEWGFDSTGAFFFRSKSVSKTPVMTIDSSKTISEIVEMRPGYADVINDAQITYGNYYNEYNSSTLPETAPTSQARFLTVLIAEDYTNFLLANDVNIASGRAQIIHDNNYKPRRRAKIRTRIIPQLDLSDVISFSFFENPRAVNNVLGDPLPTNQQLVSTPLGTPKDVAANAIIGKVIGMTVNVLAQTMEIECQEVL